MVRPDSTSLLPHTGESSATDLPVVVCVAVITWCLVLKGRNIVRRGSRTGGLRGIFGPKGREEVRGGQH